MSVMSLSDHWLNIGPGPQWYWINSGTTPGTVCGCSIPGSVSVFFETGHIPPTSETRVCGIPKSYLNGNWKDAHIYFSLAVE